MSVVVIARPRYLSSAINSSMHLLFLERKGVGMFLQPYFVGFTRRHIGAARTRDRSPAAINNCAS